MIPRRQSSIHMSTGSSTRIHVLLPRHLFLSLRFSQRANDRCLLLPVDQCHRRREPPQWRPRVSGTPPQVIVALHRTMKMGLQTATGRLPLLQRNLTLMRNYSQSLAISPAKQPAHCTRKVSRSSTNSSKLIHTSDRAWKKCLSPRVRRSESTSIVPLRVELRKIRKETLQWPIHYQVSLPWKVRLPYDADEHPLLYYRARGQSFVNAYISESRRFIAASAATNKSAASFGYTGKVIQIA